MASQNKVTKNEVGGSREDELEKDLALVHDSQRVAEGNEIVDNTEWDITATNMQREFFIKQGTRMRHPDEVLHRFGQVAQDGGAGVKKRHIEAFQKETQKATLPDSYEYRPRDDGMTVMQLGLAAAAHEAYRHSAKPKNQKMNKLFSSGF